MTVRKFISITVKIAAVVCLLMCCGFTAFASEPIAMNYSLIIDDRADLLDDTAEKSLAEMMEPVTAYGNAYFVSIEKNSTSAENAAIDLYRAQFGSESGVIFLMDMDNSMLVLHSEGEMSQKLKKGDCNSIADNVYKMAHNCEYQKCAEEVFREVNAKLSGQKIAQPMKTISNVLLAAVLAAVLNYFVAMYFSKKLSSTKVTGDGTAGEIAVTDLVLTLTERKEEYSPVSKSGSGGGMSGGGGSSSSGSTGSHSF